MLNFSLSRVACCLGPWLLRPKALEIGFWSSKSAFCPVGTVGTVKEAGILFRTPRIHVYHRLPIRIQRRHTPRQRTTKHAIRKGSPWLEFQQLKHKPPSCGKAVGAQKLLTPSLSKQGVAGVPWGQACKSFLPIWQVDELNWLELSCQLSIFVLEVFFSCSKFSHCQNLHIGRWEREVGNTSGGFHGPRSMVFLIAPSEPWIFSWPAIYCESSQGFEVESIFTWNHGYFHKYQKQATTEHVDNLRICWSGVVESELCWMCDWFLYRPIHSVLCLNLLAGCWQSLLWNAPQTPLDSKSWCDSSRLTDCSAACTKSRCRSQSHTAWHRVPVKPRASSRCQTCWTLAWWWEVRSSLKVFSSLGPLWHCTRKFQNMKCMWVPQIPEWGADTWKEAMQPCIFIHAFCVQVWKEELHGLHGWSFINCRGPSFSGS